MYHFNNYPMDFFRNKNWKADQKNLVKKLAPFDLETFQQRLRETVAWCKPRFTMEYPKWSLRSRPLPEGYEFYELALEADIIYDLMQSVIQKHITAFRDDPQSNWNKVDLAEGRLLISRFYPMYEGTSCGDTDYFIDNDDFPPWDGWVDLIAVEDHSVLISWIPPEMLKMVDDAVNHNSTANIMWIEDKFALEEYPFCHELKAAGLFYEKSDE